MEWKQQLCERYVWRTRDVYACKSHREVWGRSIQIGGVVGMCGHNVDDVRFWVTAACMEGNRVRDGVSRYDALI